MFRFLIFSLSQMFRNFKQSNSSVRTPSRREKGGGANWNLISSFKYLFTDTHIVRVFQRYVHQRVALKEVGWWWHGKGEDITFKTAYAWKVTSQLDMNKCFKSEFNRRRVSRGRGIQLNLQLYSPRHFHRYPFSWGFLAIWKSRKGIKKEEGVNGGGQRKFYRILYFHPEHVCMQSFKLIGYVKVCQNWNTIFDPHIHTYIINTYMKKSESGEIE